MDRRFSIEMPRGAKVLTVQVQDGQPFIWAMVDPDNTFELTEHRSFCVIGTGFDFELERLAYIGTFQHVVAKEVWHLFEEK
jgi:hypothetical protein